MPLELLRTQLQAEEGKKDGRLGKCSTGYKVTHRKVCLFFLVSLTRYHDLFGFVGSFGDLKDDSSNL